MTLLRSRIFNAFCLTLAGGLSFVRGEECCSRTLHTCLNWSDCTGLEDTNAIEACKERCFSRLLYWIDTDQLEPKCKRRFGICSDDDECCGDMMACMEITDDSTGSVPKKCDIPFCCSSDLSDCMSHDEKDYCNYSEDNCKDTSKCAGGTWIDRREDNSAAPSKAPTQFPTKFPTSTPIIPPVEPPMTEDFCCSLDGKTCMNKQSCHENSDICLNDCYGFWIAESEVDAQCMARYQNCESDSDCCGDGEMSCVAASLPSFQMDRMSDGLKHVCDKPACCSPNEIDCLAGGTNTDECNHSKDNCGGDDCPGHWIDRRTHDRMCADADGACATNDDCCGIMVCGDDSKCEYPEKEGICCSWNRKECVSGGNCNSSEQACNNFCSLSWINPYYQSPTCMARNQPCQTNDECCDDMWCMVLGTYNRCQSPVCCSADDGATCVKDGFCNVSEERCNSERCSGASWIDRKITFQSPGDGAAVLPSAWEGPFELPLVAVAVANLVDGKLLLWSAFSKMNWEWNGQGYTWTAIFDPSTKNYTEALISKTDHDMFCPGTAVLSDGRVMVTGGSDSEVTTFYNPTTGEWTKGKDMKIRRGYHSMTVLGDGTVFTLGGSWSGGEGGKSGEVWSESEGWTIKSGVPCVGSLLTDDLNGIYRSDNHQWLFTAPGGNVFHAGPSARTHWINVDGEGKVTESVYRGTDAMNGNAVMFDIGKILTVGGAPNYSVGDALSDAHVIDVNDEENVTVEQTGSLNHARSLCHSVVLPSGDVVVIGGMARVILFSDQGAVFTAELWNHTTGQFTELSGMKIPRTYHSVAILLNDGRVFAAGGGLCGTCKTNHWDGEILTPPYLMKSDGTPVEPDERPAILNATTEAYHGTTITVTMDSENSHEFALTRLGAATHSVNNDARRIPLKVSDQNGADFSLDIPANPNITLPGSYQLFALNEAGIPSMAKIIHIPVSTQA